MRFSTPLRSRNPLRPSPRAWLCALGLALALPSQAPAEEATGSTSALVQADCNALFCRPRQASLWHGAAFGAAVLAVVGLARRPRSDA